MADDDRRIFASLVKEVLGADVATAGDAASSAIPGWNSMSFMKLVARIEKSFGVRLAIADLVRIRGLGDLRALLVRHGREVG